RLERRAGSATRRAARRRRRAGLLFRARVLLRSGSRHRRRGHVDVRARRDPDRDPRARQHLRRPVPSGEESARGHPPARELPDGGSGLMLKKRLIPVLVLRDGTVVRSVNFKHTNVIHWKPLTAVDFFNKWAVDEIVVLDVSRTKDQRAKF